MAAVTDGDWKTERMFMSFSLPHPFSEIPYSDWSEMASVFLADIRWLLALPVNRFWSIVQQEDSLHTSLTSFLLEAPRPYSADFNVLSNSEAGTLFSEILKAVFLAYARMATYRETETSFNSSESYGDLIYNHFVFDVAKMMDLSALYGSSNSALLSKMIANIFNVQPKFNEDLSQAAESLPKILERVIHQLGLEDESSQTAGAAVATTPLPYEELKDTIDYVLDTFATLSSFVEIYPPASEVFISHDALKWTAHFYETTVPFLCDALQKAEDPEKVRQQADLLFARKQLLSFCHSLVYWTTIQPVLNSSDLQTGETCAEKWLYFSSLCVLEKHFLIDYNRLFPFHEDLDLLTQSGITMEHVRVQYLEDALRSYLDEFGLTSPATKPAAHSGTIASRVNGLASEHDPSIDQVADVAISSLVTQVKDLLPDLDDVFIKRCLEHYDYNAESVINAVLENNLPPHLTETPEPIPVPVKDVREEDKVVGKQRRTKIVRFGELKESLNPEAVPKAAILENAFKLALEYEDEYDDTYDSHAVGAAEPDAVETEFGRAVVTPRVLRGKEDEGNQGEEEDDDEEIENVEGGANQQPRDEFVANPAEMRERAEQQRQNRGRRGGRGFSGPPPPRNVVGGPRGQGQEKDVLIARRHKTENKSRGRRNLADRKRREF